MIFSLLIIGSPSSSQACTTALSFCQATLEAGHTIHRIFLLDDAAELAHPQCIARELQQAWQGLQQKYELDIVVCVNSAKKHHIDNTETLANGFVISGMGQLIDASASCDRLITFGQ